MQRGNVFEDRFVIEHLAGSGGMGEVYRASDQQTGHPVAIKVLRGNLSSDVARFDREARILSAMDDARVVRHIAHGTSCTGDPYLVMEWLEGEDLGKRIARQRLSPAESVTLCTSIASALGKLHEQGVVHRDMKPSNVFLVNGETNQMKLLDFGIAQVEASTRMTGTGTLMGTFGYMAPEQASGTKDVDARADVFALGCVLFECITGEPAFGGSHPMAILTKILFEDTPRVADRVAGVPVELETLVGRLLSKNRDDRPRNGHAAAEALEMLGEMPRSAMDATVQCIRSPVLTDSEQRALAVILVSAPKNDAETNRDDIEAAARAWGGATTRLLDGSLAILVAGTGVVTDVATQAARCALSVGASAKGRQVVLAMGRGHGTGADSIGPTIDRAARLFVADVNDSGGVTLDAAAVGLLDARFDVRDESGVYVLAGERDVAEVRTLLGKPTPCVGRDRELRMLTGFLEDCIGDEPHAQAALVTAPPGVGKSRLGHEFLQKVRRLGGAISVWFARGEPLRAGSAFSLARQLVHGASNIRGGEPVEERREKLRARVAEHVHEREQRRVADFLGEMIGAPFSDEDNLPLRAARLDAQLMSDQLHAALGDFLAAECAANPVLIFLEDLHWGDVPTVDVLGRALGDLSEKPLFVLALARPEVRDVFPKLWAGRPMQEIGMSALSKKASERLVEYMLGDGISRSTVQRIVDLSAGNAFYLEELIRAAAEGRGDDLPQTVVAMVQSRIGALSDAERKLLRAASIFGETFWTGAVSTLHGDMRSGKVDDKLRALVDEEFFVKRTESRFSGEIEYAFRHALVREGAYAMLTEEDCALGHRLAGEWLEQHGETDALVLAVHFQKGGEGPKAARYFLRVAEIANTSGDGDSAVTQAQQGLACGPVENVRIDLLGAICESAGWKFDLASIAFSHASDLLRIAVPGSIAWARGLFGYMASSIVLGKVDGVFVSADALLKEIPSPEASQWFIFVCGATIGTLDMMGQIPRADALMDKARLLLSQPEIDALARTHDLGNRSSRIVTTGRGHPWAARQMLREAIPSIEAIGYRRTHAAVQIIHGMSEWYLGNADAALAVLAHPRISDKELAFLADLRNFALIWFYADCGNMQDARAVAEQYAQDVRGIPPREARAHWTMAEVLRRTSEFDRADQEIEAALAMCAPVDRPGILATLSMLRLAQGKPDEALVAAEDGMARMQAMDGACGFFRNAFLRLAHAEALLACNRHEDANVAIANAKEWLLSLAAEIDDDAYKKSFLENVPENRRILELAAQRSA